MDTALRRNTALRFGLMATGMLALLGGLWAGLLRLGWAGPFPRANLPAIHGPLMVCGFLGTLISLERAVALDQAWAFLAPAATGIGGLLTLAGVGGTLGPLLITAGSFGLVAIFGVVLSIQVVPFAVVMTGGAAAWMGGNLLWLSGWPVHALVPWWIGFLVLTIAGERLELSRMLFHAPWTETLFLALVGLLGAGLVLSVGAPNLGFRAMGAGLAAVALWLGVYDMARRTVRAEGLTRFIAVCLIAGYVWLFVGGGLALYFGNTGGGYVYDATLHAIFVGFVFSMIFGHAPVIFPSVLGISIPYRPEFYVHVGLLHGALLLRMIGDLAYVETLRTWGGWGNAIAILFFLGATVSSVLRDAPDSHEQGTKSLSQNHGPSSTKTSPPQDVPDLDLPASQ
ncbi:MAG: hypothetical protein ABEK75_01570 [Salinibacter sp.]